MQMTEEGYALIRAQEGFRGEAYRDPAGVWTIGFGHTSAAGPPEVRPGLRVSRAEGEAIFLRDVDQVARRVQRLVTTHLSDRQFSALVSFAYNVGTGAFASSSVLQVVNAGDLARVPERLTLWNKAGGRVLPGLVKRRAAEAALFMMDAAPAPGTVPEGFLASLWQALISLFATGRGGK
ncbi:MAG: lysozyme [Proteobacteria bacterium]|nr:lysozyme [Pseudomonadota bacterium]